MIEQQHTVRICKLLGGSGVPEWRGYDGNLCPVVCPAGGDLLHGPVPDAADVALALDDGAHASKVGDNVDTLVAGAAAADAHGPSGLAQQSGAVGLVAGRRQQLDVDDALGIGPALGVPADGIADRADGAERPRVFDGKADDDAQRNADYGRAG